MIKKIWKFGLSEYNKYQITAQQSLLLMIYQVLFIIFNIGIKSIQTKGLGAEDYGILIFFLAIVNFFVLFFRFGITSSVKAILTKVKTKKEEREIIGAGFVTTLFISIFFAIFIFISSFFIDSIFNTNIKFIIQIASPLTLILPFRVLISEMATGSNKIKNEVYFGLSFVILYIIPLYILFLLGQLSILKVIFIQFAAMILAILYVMKRFNPYFKNLKKRAKQIWKKNKEYGLKAYYGQVATQAGYKIDQLLIPYFVNTLWLGYYAIIVLLTSLLSMPPQALMTSMFKSLATRKKIPKKAFMYTISWLIISSLILILLGKYIILYVFSEEFLPALILLIPLIIAVIFQSVNKLYNHFIEAHQKGNYKRNADVTGAIASVVFISLLTPFFGALGAAIASAIAMFITLVVNRYYYQKIINELK